MRTVEMWCFHPPGEGQQAFSVMVGRHNKHPHSQLPIHLLGKLLHVLTGMGLGHSIWLHVKRILDAFT